MATIYIASHVTPDTVKQHLYLVYDPNSDGDNNPGTGGDVNVIRGGPQYDPDKQPVEWALYSWGDVILEVGVNDRTPENYYHHN